MKPGRELDQLVAEKVMGFKSKLIKKHSEKVKDPPYTAYLKAGDPFPNVDTFIFYKEFADGSRLTKYYFGDHDGCFVDEYGDRLALLPMYSRDIAAVWEVLEEMHRRGHVWVIEQADTAEIPTVHIVNPTPAEKREGYVHFIDEMEKISDASASVPHAICLAALRAVGVKL